MGNSLAVSILLYDPRFHGYGVGHPRGSRPKIGNFVFKGYTAKKLHSGVFGHGRLIGGVRFGLRPVVPWVWGRATPWFQTQSSNFPFKELGCHKVALGGFWAW